MRKLFPVGGVLAVIIALALFAYAGRYGATPPFRNADGALVEGSIAEMRRVRLGGVEQSILIRGRSADAPILIWLHGGPGMDETGLLRHFNGRLEDHFLVIYWTQRGTGRSYDRSIPATSMRLSQFVSDLDQLVEALKAEFRKEKVALIGHSWGTNIGVSYAQRHPANVSAYAGIGQIVNSAEGERRSYAFTLAEAQRRNDKDALADLTKIGAPPYPLNELIAQRDWLEKFGGGNFRKPTPMLDLMVKSINASEVTWLDAIKFRAAAEFSLGTMMPEIELLDWTGVTRFSVPVVIVSGRFDHNTDGALAYNYYNAIEAPSKDFEWFEQSAHSPQFEEPDAFNAFIIDRLLPLARGAPVRAGESASADDG